MKSNRVTIRQAKILKELGYRDLCNAHIEKGDSLVKEQKIMFDRNKVSKYVNDTTSVPTVDEAIDFVRRKFNVVVYNTAAPYVPQECNKIFYGYRVKYCNCKRGWNFREYLGTGKWSSDHYAAKRNALTIALNYITKKRNSSRKKSTVSSKIIKI